MLCVCVCLVEDIQIQQATDYIKSRYQRKQLMKSPTELDTWPPFHSKSYTNLALMHQSIIQVQTKQDNTKKTMVQRWGRIGLIPIITSSIKLGNIYQIFTPITSDNHSPMSILIEGHPGIGKTTLCKEICLRWANNELLTSDKLLLLLMLRDPNVQKITSTEELLRYTLPADQVQPVLNYLHTNNGAGVTFIIDGFDELSCTLRYRSFLKEIIEGDILPKARVLVTSRPSASACLHQNVDRRIEVLGFEKSSKEQYVEEALKSYPSKLQELKEHFQLYPNIDAMCYIPLSMAIIVFLCLLGSLPQTATEFFSSFILHTVCRHLKKTGKIAQDDCMQCVPDQVQDALKHLEKVAFDGLVEDKIVFTMDDLPDMCRDDPTCYGLLQSVECYCPHQIGTPSKSFNFLHLEVQEYFAAKFLTTLPDNEVLELLEKSFYINKNNESFDDSSGIFYPDDPDPDSQVVRFSNVWVMYCGITRGQCRLLRHYLSAFSPGSYDDFDCMDDYYFSMTTSPPHDSNGVELTNDDDPLSLMQGRDEYHPVSAHHNFSASKHAKFSFQVIPENASIELRLSSNQKVVDTLTISPYILENPLYVLYLFQCFVEANDFELSAACCDSFKNNEINLSDQRLLPYHLVSLGFFLSKSQNKIWDELNLHLCYIGDHGINLLHHYIGGSIKGNHEIIKINLNSNNLTGVSLSFISDIALHLQLRILKLAHNKINGIKHITSAIMNTVKVLELNNNGLTAEEAPAVVAMMVCLEELNISFNEFGDDGAVILSEGIAKTTTLKVLHLGFNNIAATGASAIACNLKHNNSLELLSINFIPISKDVAEVIAQAIAINKKLKELSLWGDGLIFREESAMIIIKSMHMNNSITKLTFCYTSSVVDNEVEAINCTRRKSKIEELKLSCYFDMIF